MRRQWLGAAQSRLRGATQKNRYRPSRRMPQSAIVSNRARARQPNTRLPYLPPEDWYESEGADDGYRLVMQAPGDGYMHVVTPDEVQARLSQLPAEFLRPLEVLQFSRMTRKKASFPCYGMQWGSTLYLYPIESDLIEYYGEPPKPSQIIEAEMYGGRWEQHKPGTWKLTWTLEAIKDFYLNNILIHELGHLLDDRNSRSVDRERYAEWFALEYGYKPSRAGKSRPVGERRHHKSRRMVG